MNNDDKNDFNKRPRQNDLIKDNNEIILNDEIEYYNNFEKYYYGYIDADDEKDFIEKEYVKIEKKISTLKDLIDLGKLYDDTKIYNIDLYTLNKLVEPLEELEDMIGMRQVKKDIVEHILFYIQKLDNKNTDMLHTVIEGPPGVGKTELGKKLAKIYLAMGILKNNIFKKASRSDMVAKYLGQTAIKTEELINSCKGGIIFIDEVYSLGNSSGNDSFSKEAIDTLNQKLTDMKNDFICIIAGYPREIEDCFFSYNPGLKSRFPIRFSIDPYKPSELLKIFKKIVVNDDWEVDKSITISFFKKNYDDFKYYGRDMENLFSKCKRTHSNRIFTDSEAKRKLITIIDLEKGFNNFLLNRSS